MSFRINQNLFAHVNLKSQLKPQTIHTEVNPTENTTSPQIVDDEPVISGGATLDSDSKNLLLEKLGMLGNINSGLVNNTPKIDITAKNYSKLSMQGLSNSVILKYFSKVKTPNGAVYELNSKYDGYNCRQQDGVTKDGQPYTHIFTAWKVNPDGSRSEVVEYINNNVKKSN